MNETQESHSFKDKVTKLADVLDKFVPFILLVAIGFFTWSSAANSERDRQISQDIKDILVTQEAEPDQRNQAVSQLIKDNEQQHDKLFKAFCGLLIAHDQELNTSLPKDIVEDCEIEFGARIATDGNIVMSEPVGGGAADDQQNNQPSQNTNNNGDNGSNEQPATDRNIPLVPEFIEDIIGL